MSSFLNKINEMLFEQNETGETAHPAKNEAQDDRPAVPIAASPDNKMRVLDSSADTEVLRILRTQVDSRSLAAQETLAKFSKSLKILEEFIPDENVRYRAAVSQISAEALLNAYKDRRGVLNIIKGEFKQAVTAAGEGEIKQKRNQISMLEAEIKGLSERLTSFVAQRDSLAGELAEQESRIRQKDQDFATAAQSIEDEIAANEARISKLMPVEKEAK